MYGLPEVWVGDDEPRRVGTQSPRENTTAALVTVGRQINTAVPLVERLESKLGKPEPRGPYLRGLPRLQVETANGERVRRRAECHVDVETTGHVGAFVAVQPPAPSGIDQIGRASCRERGWSWGGAVSW